MAIDATSVEELEVGSGFDEDGVSSLVDVVAEELLELELELVELLLELEVIEEEVEFVPVANKESKAACN
jgi:hypothetical protein